MYHPGMDPRVYFAAERTLLAWVRTGLTLVALGFVVARFGFFMTLLGLPGKTASPIPIAAFGVALALLGSVAIAGATVNHLSVVRRLPAADVPPQAMPWLPVAFAWVVAALGMGLALLLLLY